MPSRREFLFQAAATAMGLGAVRLLPGCETIDVEPKVEGSAFDFITRNDSWYWQSGHGTTQDEAKALELSRANWSLRLTGPDGEIGTLDFDALRSYEEEGRGITYVKTMRCVVGAQVGPIEDTYISTGVFSGIPLHEIFEDFEVPVDSTNKIHTFGADGFTSNITVDRATQTGSKPLPAILAYRMNGDRLPRLRGGPVRLIVPEMWGYKNMKWLERLHFTPKTEPFGGYEDGLFKNEPAQDIIDEPGRIAHADFLTTPTARSGVELQGPDVTIQGATVVGGARVESVEVSLDGGAFESVEPVSMQEVLASESVSASTRRALENAVNFGDEQGWPPRSVWLVWSKTFEGLTPGSHEVTIRSTDSKGRTTRKTEDEVGDVEQYRVAPKVSVTFTVTG